MMTGSRPVLLVIALFAAAGAAGAALTTGHFSSDAEASVFFPSFSFVAEGRIGDRAGAATFELDIGGTTSAPSQTAQHAWASARGEAFELAYHRATGLVTFALGGVMLTYEPDAPFTDILLRTRAIEEGTTARLDSLFLNGEAVNDTSFANGDAGGIDILRVRGADLANGFALTGRATLSWAAAAPEQSRLAFQLQAGEAVEATRTESISWGGVKSLFR
ncbi:MAG: choice-of-anchor W domain-containing protein [Candidatus Eisenbacteria bacterium]